MWRKIRQLLMVAPLALAAPATAAVDDDKQNFCTIWMWAYFDAVDQVMFLAPDLMEMPKALQEQAVMLVVVPMALQDSDECKALLREGQKEPELGREEIEVRRKEPRRQRRY